MSLHKPEETHSSVVRQVSDVEHLDSSTNSCCSLQYQLVWYAIVRSVMMRQCAGGQELTIVSPAGTFSINPIIPVRLLVIMSAPHSE